MYTFLYKPKFFIDDFPGNAKMQKILADLVNGLNVKIFAVCPSLFLHFSHNVLGVKIHRPMYPPEN